MKKFFSIVIPCYNEEGNIEPLIDSIQKSCDQLQYEIVAVNDGSTDNTLAELQSIKNGVPALKIVNLKKNFGQTAAMAAGIDNASGDIIVMMDGDQQNDPADIRKLIAKIYEGNDVVSGWRKNRRDGFILRRFPSVIANKLISYLTGVSIHDFGCTLKAYRRSTFRNFQLYGEMHRFIPAWCAWQGGKVAEMEVNHHPRTIGKSKYGLFRIFKVLIDLSTLKFFSSYLSKPNYLFSGTGMVFFLGSVLATGVALFDKFGANNFPAYRIPLLLMSLGLGLVAVFLVMMGFLAELLVKIYFQNNNQKPYQIANEEDF